LGLIDHLYGIPHRAFDVPAEFEVLVRAGEPAIPCRVIHINCVREPERRDKVARLNGVEWLHDMGEEEPVEVHHHRQEHIVVLSDPECHESCIVGFLHGAHVHLQPAGVALLQGVGMLCPDVPAGPDRAVDRCHDHRQS